MAMRRRLSTPMNLVDNLPRQADKELFTELLVLKGMRIERIVSTGQSTPDRPYNQEYDEWVLLVSGAAGLWIEGEGERSFVRAITF
jgi:cupin 2 domain-containing protein